MHSLLAGGATTAANAGMPDRNFKRHGRGKSESAKDGYVEDSLESFGRVQTAWFLKYIQSGSHCDPSCSSVTNKTWLLHVTAQPRDVEMVSG